MNYCYRSSWIKEDGEQQIQDLSNYKFVVRFALNFFFFNFFIGV